MFAFLNDISISPNGVLVADNWTIIKELMNVSAELQNYGIRRIRVPEEFTNESIAGSHSLAYYAANTKGDDARLLLSFMDNRFETRTSEIIEAVDEAQKDKVVDITLNNKSSQLLTEAYLMDCPAISFETHADSCVNFLDCTYHVLSDDSEIHETGVEIENLYTTTSFTIHRVFLVDWKLEIVFSKTRWKPKEQPIWNKHTSHLLKELKFPLNPKGIRDKKEELLEVGTMVAELNAWQFDKDVTRHNNNAGQRRKIFHSKNNGNNFYLSIDFENGYGRFEVHDHKGKHIGEIDFEKGEYKEGRDNTGGHDIRVN